MYGQPNFGGGGGGFPGRPMGGMCGGGCGPRPWGGPCVGGGGGGFGGGGSFVGGGKGGCCKGGSFGKGTGGFEDEDRSRDWYCPNCKERNFLKRTECYKCRTVKPKDVDCSVPPFKLNIPASGMTCNGMVKSYNRKGFGFLMVLGADYGQDIYYTRENLSSRLQTRDIPGQHVTFELHRYPDGKLTALNIRPIGEEKDDPRTRMPPSGKGGPGHRDDEDRTRDWVCEGCNERNFVKRFECFKCGKPRGPGGGFSEPGGSSSSGHGGGHHGEERSSAPPLGPPPRRLSPHAGSRAMREALAKKLAGGGSRSRSRSHNRKKKRRKASSGSSSDDDDDDDSSSGSSAKEKKNKHKKKAKKKRSRSSSSSSGKSKKSDDSSSKSSDCKMEEPAAAAAAASGSGKHDKSDPEVEAAKAEALEQLMKLQKVEPKEARMSEWRALLRKWHPDKNPDRVEVATAVFQFLQKGKAIVDTN